MISGNRINIEPVFRLGPSVSRNRAVFDELRVASYVLVLKVDQFLVNIGPNGELDVEISVFYWK